jgi:hypothetical protein
MDTVQVLLELTARFVAERQSWMDTVQVLLELAADKKTSTRIFKVLSFTNYYSLAP